MEAYQIIIICAYLCLLAIYFYVETRPQLFGWRVAIKSTMATAYLALAIVNICLFGGEHTAFKIVIGFACGFAWFGDIFLLFKKYFGVGVAFFLFSNIAVVSAQINLVVTSGLTAADVWWGAIIFVVVYGALLVLQIIKYCDFGKYAVPLNIYIAAMTISASLGVVIAFQGLGALFCIFGTGIAMFMTSDYLLGAYKFKFPLPGVLRANSGFYFIGMLLIAMSLAF